MARPLIGGCGSWSRQRARPIGFAVWKLKRSCRSSGAGLARVRSISRTSPRRAVAGEDPGRLVDDPCPPGLDKFARALRPSASRLGRRGAQDLADQPAAAAVVWPRPEDDQRIPEVLRRLGVSPCGRGAARLRPWLHCPLDKVVMEALRSHDTDTWRRRIWDAHYRQRGVAHQQRSSMSTVDEPAYRAWQSWIRELSPKKPILIDATWSLNRPMARSITLPIQQP
jgi:hypothetical protein